MGLFSALIAAPITLTARSLTMANRAMQLVIGILTLGIGAHIIFATAPLALAGQ